MRTGARDGHKWSTASIVRIDHIRTGKPVSQRYSTACLKEPSSQ